MIAIKPADSFVEPNNSVTGGSMSSELCVNVSYILWLEYSHLALVQLLDSRCSSAVQQRLWVQIPLGTMLFSLLHPICGVPLIQVPHGGATLLIFLLKYA